MRSQPQNQGSGDASAFRRARLLSRNTDGVVLVSTFQSQGTGGDHDARTQLADRFRRQNGFELPDRRARNSVAVARAYSVFHGRSDTAFDRLLQLPNSSTTSYGNSHVDMFSLLRQDSRRLSPLSRAPALGQKIISELADDGDLDNVTGIGNSVVTPSTRSSSSTYQLISAKGDVDSLFSSLFSSCVKRGLSRADCLHQLHEFLAHNLQSFIVDSHDACFKSDFDRRKRRQVVRTREYRWLSERYAMFRSFSADQLEEKFVAFPHIAEVCSRLAVMYHNDGDFEQAVQLSSQALQIKLWMCRYRMLYSMDCVLEQWKYLRQLLLHCPSLSRRGVVMYAEKVCTDMYVEWMTREERRRDDPDFILCQYIMSDISTLRQQRFEKWANVLTVYALIAFAVFMIVRCYVYSSCTGPSQLVSVDRGTFETTPSSFHDLELFPRCASMCAESTSCTCEPQDLDCSSNARPNNPRPGSTCLCRRPVCDACGICGTMRMIVRDYAMEVFFFSTMLDILLLLIGLVAVTFPAPTLDGKTSLDNAFALDRNQAIKDVSLLIPHHGGRGPLEGTLKAALRLFPPEKIFVCHNGPSDAPLDFGKVMDTYTCVQEVSEWYRKHCGSPNAPPIHYVWSCEGNKTLAVFLTCLMFSKDKYVALMDNDCLLPKDLSMPIHAIDQKEKVKAYAYLIRASNVWQADGRRNIWPAYQDLEYKKASLMKLLQSQMSSILFAHGAFAVWKREACLDVMMRHNANFHGEDMQMGMLLHRLNKGFQMKVVGNVSVPTATPVVCLSSVLLHAVYHFICCPWNTLQAKQSGKNAIVRLLTAPFQCSSWGCKHDMKSLFVQRAKSWDSSAQRMVWESIALLLFYWNRSVLSLKPFVFYELCCVIQDYIRVPLLVYILYSTGQTQRWAIFTGMSLIGRALIFMVMELWTFRRREDLRSGVVIAVTYSFYNFVLLFTRCVAVVYNLAVSLPRSRNGQKIKNRSQLPGVIHGRYISCTSEDPPEPLTDHLSNRLPDVRSCPYVQGAKRLPNGSGWQLIQWMENQWVHLQQVPDNSPSNAPKIHKETAALDWLGYLLLFAFVSSAVLIAIYASISTFSLVLCMITSFVVVFHASHFTWRWSQ